MNVQTINDLLAPMVRSFILDHAEIASDGRLIVSTDDLSELIADCFLFGVGAK